MTLATLVVLVSVAALRLDSTAAAPMTPLTRAMPAAVTGAHSAVRDTTPSRRRPRAVELSDGYERRLTIHRWGGYAMIPLFGAQYVLGERMYRQKTDIRLGRRTDPIDGDIRTAHRLVAIGVGGVFAVNTVTGVWNLSEARGVTRGRALRTTHTLLMLVSDAGLVASGVMGVRHQTHRTVAITSMGVAVASGAMMLAFNRD